jgi:hypothetical protein
LTNNGLLGSEPRRPDYFPIADESGRNSKDEGDVAPQGVTFQPNSALSFGIVLLLWRNDDHRTALLSAVLRILRLNPLSELLFALTVNGPYEIA